MAYVKSIPSVTFNMIVDVLQSEKILAMPACPPRSFKWASSPHWEKGVVLERDMIIVCQDKAVEQAAQRYPQSFLIVITGKDELEAIESIPNQMLVIKDSPTTVNLLQKLQNFFLSIQAWLSELSRAPSSLEGLGTIMQKSSVTLKAPLLLYDADSSIVAKSGFNASSTSCKIFQKREKEALNSVAMLRRSPVQLKGSNESVFIENELIQSGGHDLFYALALFEKMPTAGQHDMFKMFAEALAVKSEKVLGRLPSTRYTVYSLFDALICGRYVSESQLDDFAYSTGLPLDSEFRLLCFKANGGEPGADPSELTHSLHRINDGKCLFAVYDGDLLALLHSKNLDKSLSNPTIDEQILDTVGSFDGFVTVSQVFDGITHFGLAYQETQLVAKHKDVLDFEQCFTVSDQQQKKVIYTYEECLRFCILDFGEMSQELKDFSFSHTILEKILAEDMENGTNDIRILASYIHHERKATVVAEKLHMHRNTVLYRIGKIEKRFGLNLDENWSRDRVLFDFSILYSKIMRDPSLSRAILGQDAPRAHRSL